MSFFSEKKMQGTFHLLMDSGTLEFMYVLLKKSILWLDPLPAWIFDKFALPSL